MNADNDVLNSIQRIINALELGWLHLVGPATPMLQEELIGYRWDDRATERGEDRPVKESDDLVDCLRYLVNRIEKTRRAANPVGGQRPGQRRPYR
jgi:chemotaxis regulatin CheY-phosphate phosphatase CheZ